MEQLYTAIEFQFLIGSLKTMDGSRKPGRIPGFQFLIGSLKTALEQNYGRSMNKVSIPHRQSKNCKTQPGNGQGRYQFQFLIGSLKTSLALTKQEKQESFNSS